MENDMTRSAIAEAFWQGRFLVYLVVIAWIVSILNFGIFGKRLNYFGVRPREWIGLPGILFSPFLHSTWRHLEGNTIAFLTYGGLIVLRSPSDFGAVTATVTLLGGLATWLLGRPPNHIGASGVTFGFLGFLLSLAFFDRSISAVILLVLIAFFYSNRLWLILPLYDRMSWEGHLFGFASGIFAARYLPEIKSIFAQFVEVLKQVEVWLR
jgi:membrane associated rhomboid family serine protease